MNELKGALFRIRDKEVSTAMNIQVVVFWDVTACSDMVGYQSFIGLCCLHLHLG